MNQLAVKRMLTVSRIGQNSDLSGSQLHYCWNLKPCWLPSQPVEKPGLRDFGTKFQDTTKNLAPFRSIVASAGKNFGPNENFSPVSISFENWKIQFFVHQRSFFPIVSVWCVSLSLCSAIKNKFFYFLGSGCSTAVEHMPADLSF